MFYQYIYVIIILAFLFYAMFFLVYIFYQDAYFCFKLFCI